MSAGELEYIRWLRQQTPSDPRVLLGPGDDAAALQMSSERPLVVASDMLLEGSCFLLAEAGAELVGRKALAVNLSDVAAMAAEPVAAFVNIGLPRQSGRRLAEDLYRGMRKLADRFQTAIAGGDTNSWDGPLVLSVTIVGQATDRGLVQRSGARPGDWLFVTGPLGGSIRGKHLTFEPRVEEAIQLHRLVDLHAMIDISDGLARDVYHLCSESGCGAVLRAQAIPVSSAAKEIHDQRSPLEHALYDGEDFELAFAVAPSDGQWLVENQPIEGLHLFHIGQFETEGFWLQQDERRTPLEPLGYEHRLG
ncbi:MAG: thiamine-monophosphate kinase [Gemmatales bacterium]|nr:MAG: thiamine-monophosphate kinase [Gemmatales bacterium]